MSVLEVAEIDEKYTEEGNIRRWLLVFTGSGLIRPKKAS